MEVKEFVKNMLKDITEAVAESKNDKHSFYLPNSNEDGIDFDLAVVLKKDAKGKVGAEIFTIMGAKVEGNVSKEEVNRIKFKVVAFERK